MFARQGLDSKTIHVKQFFLSNSKKGKITCTFIHLEREQQPTEKNRYDTLWRS